MNPLISVVIPAFNQASYLPTSLDSVFTQTYSHLEIIVVDDGSTDTTQTICADYAARDSRLKVIRQPNLGPSAARNRGISEAHGDYICLLDADDVMDPRRIALQYEVMREDPSIDIVYTALQHIDSDGKPCGEMHSQDFPPENFLAQMFFRNVIPGPSTILAKRICLSSQPYNEQFKHAEDYELMMRLAHLYRFKYIDLLLTSYRRHDNNLSNDLRSHREAELKVLQQYDQAHVAQAVARTSLSDEEKTLLLGKILFNQEHVKEALAIFKKLKTPLALFYAGNCHLWLDQNELALRCYQESLAIDSSNPACHNNLGVAYARLHQEQKAQTAFRQALALKQGYLDPQYNLAHLSDTRPTWRELRQDLIPYKETRT